MAKRNHPHNQMELFAPDQTEPPDSGPVTCLGMTFPTDEERRKHFLGILREELNPESVSRIEKSKNATSEIGFLS